MGKLLQFTSIDGLWCHLLLGACVILSRSLLVDSCLRTIFVEFAGIVHRQLRVVVLPAEDVIAMCCSSANEMLACMTGDPMVGESFPPVHAVDEWVRIRGPLALVRERRNIPHELIHDLRELDR
jgi:hypothetical protein